MERTINTYNTLQPGSAERLLEALKSVPQDKRTVMTVMAETFISGMRTQERLTASSRNGKAMAAK